MHVHEVCNASSQKVKYLKDNQRAVCHIQSPFTYIHPLEAASLGSPEVDLMADSLLTSQH